MLHRAATVICLLTFVLAGCEASSDGGSVTIRPMPPVAGPKRAHPSGLRVPRGIVADGVEALGGLTAWRNVGAVSYNAVVTIYDDAGRAYVNRHGQVLRLGNWELTARATRPQGTWWATVGRDNHCTFKGSPEVLAEDLRDRLIKVLPLVKHRIAGVLNLVATDEQPGASRRMIVNGMDVIRVSVVSASKLATAYYFDAARGQLLYLSDGADAPNQPGTVTRYTYRRFRSGLRFPRQIDVVKTGRHVLIGEAKVLEMKIDNVTFHYRNPEAQAEGL